MKEFKYDVVQLIRGVRDRPCIWDKSLDIYKDRFERRRAWEEIFGILDEGYDDLTREEKRITGEHILHKWTNIRDTFIKTLKSRLGKPKRKYVLHDELQFLVKIQPNGDQDKEYNNEEYQNDDSAAYLKQEGDTEASLSSHETEDPGLSISNVTSYTNKRSTNEFDDSQSTSYNVNSYSSHRKKSRRLFSDEPHNTFSRKKSRKTDKNNSDDQINVEEPIINDRLADIDFVQVDAGDDPRVMNEDEAFFASLLPTVVKYNEDEKLEFRIEVLNVMKQIKDKRKWTGE